MLKVFSSVLLCCFLSGVATATVQPSAHVQKNGVYRVLLAASPVVSKTNAIAIAMVVQAQLDAFAADDASRAFSYAAPNIKALFGTPEKFLQMVQSSYPVVYRPTSVTFLAPESDGAAIIQPVAMTDAQGNGWVAVYRLEPVSGQGMSWLIAGCVLRAKSSQTWA
tara:strand:- start:1015 stop:1509 length:495 start_codon:yes stop_codon:yes gene_type:complete